MPPLIFVKENEQWELWENIVGSTNVEFQINRGIPDKNHPDILTKMGSIFFRIEEKEIDANRIVIESPAKVCAVKVSDRKEFSPSCTAMDQSKTHTIFY